MVDLSFHQPKINEIIAITISPIVRYVMNLNLLFDLFTSFNIIIDEIFGYDYSIPQAVIDSKKCTNCMGFNRK